MVSSTRFIVETDTKLTTQGQAYEIKTEADKEWKSYRFGKVSKTSLRLDTSNVIESWLILKGPCGNPESHYHLDTPSPR